MCRCAKVGLLMMTCESEAAQGTQLLVCKPCLKTGVLLAALVQGKRMLSNSLTLLPACTSTKLYHSRALKQSILTVKMAAMWIGSRSRFHNTQCTKILSGQRGTRSWKSSSSFHCRKGGSSKFQACMIAWGLHNACHTCLRHTRLVSQRDCIIV